MWACLVQPYVRLYLNILEAHDAQALKPSENPKPEALKAANPSCHYRTSNEPVSNNRVMNPFSVVLTL